jgi:NADP-dependent 3-hydroxy acid dehydrogenase YdfG
VRALSDSLRPELASQHVRVSVIEPGAVKAELLMHVRPEVRAQWTAARRPIEQLEPEDVADAIAYSVTRARRIASS